MSTYIRPFPFFIPHFLSFFVLFISFVFFVSSFEVVTSS
jgi:hypothetical protein